MDSGHNPQTAATAPTPDLVRVPHPALSLWQSSVRQVVANHVAHGQFNSPEVTAHRLVQDADAYAHQQHALGADPQAGRLAEVDRTSSLFEVALAHAHDLVHGIGAFAGSIGQFTNLDPLFIECVFEFVKYYWLSQRQPQYRDWKKSPRGLAFGMIEDPIPSGARVALIGDWGTGLPDARLLLAQLLLQVRPAVLIHIGDVYYSGTPAEFQRNFTMILEQVLEGHPELGPGPRVYAIPGNHDYYAGGAPFYSLIDNLNAESARQSSSYFSLRTEDGAFQLLGMDTGFNDRAPGVAFNSAYTAPMPQASEVDWLHDKLESFEGQTVLLSHHQAFSAHSPLNGPDSGQPPHLNKPLTDAFAPHLPKVAAWFWGHEHNLMVFNDDQLGVRKGRLIGCSAFEMAPGDDPYAIKFPEVSAKPIRLGRAGPWYNHGCAVIDLGRLAITYYQMPAWTETEPTPAPELVQLADEDL
jgi:hypothetical protein